jgi:hypothetical protein
MSSRATPPACFSQTLLMEGSTARSNKELKQTKHGELWSFAA